MSKTAPLAPFGLVGWGLAFHCARHLLREGLRRCLGSLHGLCKGDSRTLLALLRSDKVFSALQYHGYSLLALQASASPRPRRALDQPFGRECRACSACSACAAAATTC
eukprot:3772122-Pyramimonas_sp.AAC.1